VALSSTAVALSPGLSGLLNILWILNICDILGEKYQKKTFFYRTKTILLEFDAGKDYSNFKIMVPSDTKSMGTGLVIF
jgi:hypothetical protein